MSEELKPCPFCGGEAKGTDGGYRRLAVVRCGRCKADRRAPTLAEAIPAWNRRTQPTDAVPTVGEVETYASWQQKRGMLFDKVDWALNEYDEYMKDDAYDAQRVLDRIIERLRETVTSLRTALGSDQ